MQATLYQNSGAKVKKHKCYGPNEIILTYKHKHFIT